MVRDDGAPLTINLEGRLFIPMRDVHGKLWSLQYISDDGRKMYHPGGSKEGSHFVIRNRTEYAEQRPLFFAEGYATAASVHALTGGEEVIAAFDAGI